MTRLEITHIAKAQGYGDRECGQRLQDFANAIAAAERAACQRIALSVSNTGEAGWVAELISKRT